MARKKHLINVHTSTGTTAPTGASLYLGEIAVQHTQNDPALWIKVGSSEASTEYEKFIGLTEITNIFNDSKILGSGYTYSGLPHVNSSTTLADAYSALTVEVLDNELVTAAALNDLNNRIRTVSGSVENIEIISALALTGVTMNNNQVPVTNNVANLGTVITAETQLSTATTGTGNVVGSIAVSNHKITSTMFSAASADQIAKLSAGTISLVASSAASVYSSAVSYVNSAITGLDSSTAVTNGKYITGIAIADGKISGITEANLPSAPAITATTAGTGNVFTAVSTTGHSMTFTKGMTAAEKSDLDALSAATTAHTSNGDIHVTANQKTAWTNGANSGASAYTMVQNLSAVTLTGVTMNGSPVSVTDKVANLGTVITAETQLSTAVTGNGNVFSSIQVANHKITMGKDVTALTGVSTPNNDNYLSVSVASNSAITVGEKNAVVADKTALSNVSATGSLVDAKAVKDYVADQITSSVDYKGATSTLPSTAAVGDLYITSANIAIPANKSATGVAVTAETGDFIIARTTGTWDVIEKNLDGAITGSLTANTLTIGSGTNNVKSLANGSNGQILTVGSNGPQWTTGVLTDTATTLAGHYTPTGTTTGGTTATTSASAIKGIVYDGKGHITSVVTGSVLTAQTSITTANGSTGNAAAAVITGITTGGTAGHQLTLNKSNKIFSASTSDSALTTVSAITSWSAQTTILGPTYSYSGIPYVFSSTSLADAYSALTNEMIKDEQVVAAALNDLNQRVTEVSGMAGDNTEIIEYIQENEEVVAAALNNLNNRVSVVETHMTGDYIPITGYIVASGITEEELTLKETDTVNEALGKLQKQALDNEEAIAAGLNDLNERVNKNTAAIARNTGVTALSGAVRSLSAVTAHGFQEMSNSIYNLDREIYDLSGSVMSISAKTSGVLTVNVNGQPQGKYCPSANTELNLEIIQEVTGEDVLLTGYQLATGTTEEELAIVATDTVNEAFGKIQKQNYDNEAVVAGALNDLDERLTAVEQGGGGGGTAVFVPGTGTDSIKSIYGGVIASGQLSYAEGSATSALSVASHVEGYNSVVGGSYTSHTINPSGADTTPGAYGHAEGRGTIVVGTNGAHAEGNRTFAQGTASHAEGSLTVAKGPGSHAEGQRTLAAGQLAHAEGMYAQAVGHITHAEGYYTSALTQYSHVEGQCCVTSGEASHAEGQYTFTLNESSHAEGRGSSGTGVSSHAEGAQTLACGSPSHSEGFYSIASGVSFHAEGYTTSALSVASHTEGWFTVARNLGEHASGRFNVSNGVQSGTDGDTFGDDNDSAQTMFSIGVGIDETHRKNAYEVMQNGDAYLLGVGSYDGTNFQTADTLQKSINDKLVGVTINGTAATVTNGVAALGTVVTAQTQLSKGTTTGTGNVVTDLSVSNHQITLAKSYSAAPADQFVTLSSATNSKFTSLSAATTAINSTLTTVSGAAHTKITNLSAATTAINSTLTTVSGAAHTKITNLSGATTAHIGNSAIHVPTASAANNGKIPVIRNGAWVLEGPVVSVYNGSNAPNPSLGNDGDIYLQTS